MLVTQSQASIISNLIAVALTLAGPRLWILLKAFGFWILDLIRKLPSCRFSQARRQQYGSRWAWCRNNILPTTEESHSELGAALTLANMAMHDLRRNRVELTATNEHAMDPQQGNSGSLLGPLLRLWENFMKKPLDIIVPLLLSLLFIGVFVAESTGTVMSARIVGDSTALSDSPRCFAPNDTFSSRALAYVDQCYHAALGTEGCNFFYNQSLSYGEKITSECPWLGFRCFNGSKAAIAFDTWYVHLRYLGINSVERYVFRRWAVCAPMITNPRRPAWEGTNVSNPDGMNNITNNWPGLMVKRYVTSCSSHQLSCFCKRIQALSWFIAIFD